MPTRMIYPENDALQEVLKALMRGKSAKYAVELRMHYAIKGAREQGVTWKKIGQTLGISAQAAQQLARRLEERVVFV